MTVHTDIGLQIIDSVTCINPGTLSKRRGAGSYAAVSIHPRVLTDEEREAEMVAHNIHDRARVDIAKI